MTEDFAINILEQYKEKPTLINEINSVEEAVWLEEALDMGIQAIKLVQIEKKYNANTIPWTTIHDVQAVQQKMMEEMEKVYG